MAFSSTNRAADVTDDAVYFFSCDLKMILFSRVQYKSASQALFLEYRTLRRLSHFYVMLDFEANISIDLIRSCAGFFTSPCTTSVSFAVSCETLRS